MLSSRLWHYSSAWRHEHTRPCQSYVSWRLIDSLPSTTNAAVHLPLATLHWFRLLQQLHCSLISSTGCTVHWTTVRQCVLERRPIFRVQSLDTSNGTLPGQKCILDDQEGSASIRDHGRPTAVTLKQKEKHKIKATDGLIAVVVVLSKFSRIIIIKRMPD